MPQLYFINGNSLADSTAVYIDSGFTLCASDGYYSDGTIIREQLGCVLQPARRCPSCGPTCGDLITFSSASGAQGEYISTIQMGALASNVGAMIIKFSPGDVPDGVIVEFNGNTYNQFSSPIFGYLAAPSGLPTFIGDSGSQAGCPAGSIIGGPFTLDQYVWDGFNFNSSGGTEIITVAPSQDKTTVGVPGYCVMVIPKTTASPSAITIKTYTVCDKANFNIVPYCPVLLSSFKASVVVETIEPEVFCFLPTDQTFYVANVTGSSPFLGLYDWVFIDPYGQTKVPNGIYKTNNVLSPNDTIEVLDGVIITITNSCS